MNIKCFPLINILLLNLFVSCAIKKVKRSPANSLNLKQFDNINQLIVSYSTIITSIHLAYYLGAKNIILVGVDHGTLDGKTTFDGYYKDIKETAWKDWNQYKNWLKKINQDTVAIKNKMKQLGVNIHSLNPFINFKLEGHKYES